MIRLMLCAVLSAGGGMAAATDYSEHVQRTMAWAEKAFAVHKTDISPKNRLTIVYEDGAGDTKPRRCAFGGPLRLGDRVYEHGIGVNSHSVLRVSLAEPAEMFAAGIGLDRNVDGTVASVRFYVSVAGENVFATNVMRSGDAVQSIKVPLNGAREFDLVVDTGGDDRAFDQADWADARVTLANGEMLWLDELEFAAPHLDQPPFSFVYGGKPSAELTGAWEQSVDVDTGAAGEMRRILTLRDPETGLEVRAVCTVYTDVPGVNWTLYFTNTGATDSPVLEAVRSLDVVIPEVTDPVLHQLEGSIAGATDWRPFSQPVPIGQPISFQPQSGRSSKGASPFFTCSWEGGGVVTAIGWTGRWTASVEYPGQALRVQAGLEKFHARLKPGEMVRGPRILQVYWSGNDVWQGYNAFRQVMLRHIMPKLDGKPVVPPIAHLSTSFYEMDDGTEADVMAHLESAKGLGFEYFWLDAYRGITRFPTIGHYVFPIEREVDPKRFPNGLAPISEAAHEAGMNFLLWFEPERICPGSLMAQEHPEWVVMPPPERMGHGGMLNLAIPEARQYVTDYLNAAIDAYTIDCLRM
jgi:alpha-galactosidase